ncbi:MAG TPA: hypothetical protein VGR02_00400 [Thermoanaerobaculia bacterium]|jgi:hypothetical protein|nr:hypothetical protein [Thermoanaerobaculia bacterium]
MRTNFFLVMLVACAALTSCTSDAAPATTIPPRMAKNHGRSDRIRAAAAFTSRYASSPFAGWKVRAEAAGPLCNVLVIRTPIVMEGAMVDAMHHGDGEYEIDDGGVQRFYLEETFRGVAYRDGSDRIWTYGAVKEAEVEELEPCH